MEMEMEMASQVDSLEEMKEPYRLAKRYDWERFMAFFRKEENKKLLDKRIDLHQRTPFHYAANCGSHKMYEEMLEMVGNRNRNPSDRQRVLEMLDDMGNTPLHEVAFAGEVEIFRSSIRKYDRDINLKQLLNMRNKLGETPVYRAAALGKTDLLNFFVQELNIDLTEHFRRTNHEDHKTILQIAVIDQFFGTALWLLERHGELANETEGGELTALQLLAKMPSAFKSQTQMGTFTNFIYLLLPVSVDGNSEPSQTQPMHEPSQNVSRNRDLESDQNNEPSQTQKMHESPQTERRLSAPIAASLWTWYTTMWKALAEEWKGIEKLRRKKEMHNLAQKLVDSLAEKDESWKHGFIAGDRTVSMGRLHSLGNRPQGNQQEEQETQEQQEVARNSVVDTPLHMAACNGITEIVKAIYDAHPQSIEHVNVNEQNILYMAVKHRQLEIFRMLKKYQMVRPLAGKIDKESNTVLHYTADFKGGSQPGYALQLQEELRWFERIEKLLPYHFTIHKNKNNQTARELFEENHGQLLKDAREWIKGTAQSCSTVAVLVANVAFAAAYTVPGGTDDSGIPKFLHQPTFTVFIIIDVVALASSLASVAMFLSILTSPCEMWDFRRSLPRKLMGGFALLFFSLAATMLAFSTTILINIKSEKNKLTSSLTFSVVFFLVSIFGMTQIPLYVGIKGCGRKILKRLKKIIPRFFLNLIKRE